MPLQQVCDGQVDCLQGEDEANCPQWVPEGPPPGGECGTACSGCRGAGLLQTASNMLKSPATKLTLCVSPARVSKDRSILQVLNRNTGAWSCVCHDHFNPVLAKAACEQMGYWRYVAAFSCLSCLLYFSLSRKSSFRVGLCLLTKHSEICTNGSSPSPPRRATLGAGCSLCWKPWQLPM